MTTFVDTDGSEITGTIEDVLDDAHGYLLVFRRDDTNAKEHILISHAQAAELMGWDTDPEDIH